MTYRESGDRYEGDWQYGKYHGKGKYTYKNGNYYQGSWLGGKRNGNGVEMKFDHSLGSPKVIYNYEGGFINDAK